MIIIVSINYSAPSFDSIPHTDRIRRRRKKREKKNKPLNCSPSSKWSFNPFFFHRCPRLLLLVGRNRRKKLSSFVASSVVAAMMITDEQMGWACPLIPPRQTHIGSWNYSTDDDVWAVVCGSHLDLSTDVPIINIKTFFFLLLMCVQWLCIYSGLWLV